LAKKKSEGYFGPTRIAVIAFVSGAFLALLPAVADPGIWTYWLVFLFLSFFLITADYLLGPRLGRLKLRLELPDKLYLNHIHDGVLFITNQGRRIRHLSFKMDTSADLEEIAKIEISDLPFGETRIEFHLVGKRRGRVEIESVWIKAAGLMGLMAFIERIVLNIVLDVYPNIHIVSRDAIRLFSSHNIQSGTRVERFRGDGAEFDHLNKYVPGFGIRSIDWKVSARHGELFSRQYRAERNRQVIIAIDSGRLMREPLNGLPRLDHAITAGLTLAYISLHVGDWVGLFSFDDKLRQYCPPVRGKEGINELNEAAGKIDYSNRETNFTLSLMEIAKHLTRRALVVVMTDFIDTITAELMMENMGRLAQRHLVLFVALNDPELCDIAERKPVDLLNMNQSMVAHQMISDRETVILKLQRMGIHCISADYEHISSSLIDSYLGFKRKEAF